MFFSAVRTHMEIIKGHKRAYNKYLNKRVRQQGAVAVAVPTAEERRRAGSAGARGCAHGVTLPEHERSFHRGDVTARNQL